MPSLRAVPKRKSLAEKRKFFSWFLLQLLVITLVSLAASSYAWGFWGKIGATHFRGMVMCLPPWQKAKLADSLNRCYSGGIIRSTKGILLKCDPETDELVEQFDWYSRGAIGSKITFHAPDYHHVVVKVLKATDVLEQYDLDRLPTWMHEALLWHHCQTWDQPESTPKDRLGLVLSVVSLTLRFAGTVDPVVGAFVTGVSVVNSVRSDPIKATPGVICFLKIRGINCLLTLVILWLLQLILLVRWKTRRINSP